MLSTIAGNSSSSVSGAVVTYTSEFKWLGYFAPDAGGTVTTLTSATVNTHTIWRLGNSFSIAEGTTSSFTTEFATYTTSAFALDVNDSVKAIWTITIG